MGIPVWCLIAPMFLVSVKAGIHDVVAQSFYEEPQSSSPAPLPTSSQSPNSLGMKEVVLFLTPEQVETLQAAGAVVQPYPEYGNDYTDVQEKFTQSVEPQKVQQYQTWMYPVEEDKNNAEVQNYYKLLNIQEINDDLSQKKPVIESTTEKSKSTPRYKTNKAQQKYKEKEYSTPYVPKKANRTKIYSQSDNEDTYVRYLPNYEHEILQMAPYEARPLFPYQFAEMQINEYIQANEKAQENSYSEGNTKVQQNTFTVINSEAQQNAFNIVHTNGHQSAFHVTNTVTPQNAFIQVSTEAYQNNFSQETPKAQQNANVQETEAQRIAYVKENPRAQFNVFRQADTHPDQHTYSEQNTDSQTNAYFQTKSVTDETGFSQVNTKAKQKAYSQKAKEEQNSSYSQVNTEAHQNEYSLENSQAEENKYPQTYVLTEQNANSVPQKTRYRVASKSSQQNDLSQTYTVTERNSYSQINPTPRKITNIVASQRAQQNTYSYTSTEAQNREKKGKQNASSEVNTTTQRNSSSQLNSAINASTQQFRNTANTEAQQNSFIEASTTAQQNSYTEVSTKSQQNSYRTHKENLRKLYKPARPSRVHLPKGNKKPRLEKITAPVTPKPTLQTYFIPQYTNEFKETLSSIEGLPPLPPLTPITPLEESLENPATPAPPAPTVQTPILHDDKVLTLLAPLYQHQTITDTISRHKEELLKTELNIRSKLQKIKESPQYYDHQEYSAELEKLTRNFGEQNALARFETTSETPTVFENQGPVTIERHNVELVSSTEVPTLVRIPKPHDVKIPVSYPAPLEFIRPFKEPKPAVSGKRPDEGVINSYGKVDEPDIIPKFSPFIENQKIPVMIPINPEQITITRHIWEH